MVRLLTDGHLDMVVGVRRDIYANAHRAGHGLGNRLLNGLYCALVRAAVQATFSPATGYSRGAS